MPKRLTDSKEALKRLIEKYNGYYEYPDWEYRGRNKTIKVKDPIYGVWEPRYGNHLNGRGHPDACKNKKDIKETFIIKAIIVHGDRYDYSQVVYVNSKTKVCILCPDHGEFWQTPRDHLKGNGCRYCANETRNKPKTHEKFVEEANIVHNNFFEYPDQYKTARKKIMIKCPKHGLFPQIPDPHLRGNGCPHCANQVSKPEKEIRDFIKDIGYESIGSCRKTIYPKELDINIPELNKAIEYNGYRWHYDRENKDCRPRGYHAEKSNLCRAKGIKLLHIREDLWIKDKEKMKDVILKFINKN